MPRRDRSVDVLVRKVRRKFELAAPDWRYIHTHFGIGYRFTPEADLYFDSPALPWARLKAQRKFSGWPTGLPPAKPPWSPLS